MHTRSALLTVLLVLSTTATALATPPCRPGPTPCASVSRPPGRLPASLPALDASYGVATADANGRITLRATFTAIGEDPVDLPLNAIRLGDDGPRLRVTRVTVGGRVVRARRAVAIGTEPVEVTVELTGVPAGVTEADVRWSYGGASLAFTVRR